jgi:hypothetical protein
VVATSSSGNTFGGTARVSDTRLWPDKALNVFPSPGNNFELLKILFRRVFNIAKSLVLTHGKKFSINIVYFIIFCVFIARDNVTCYTFH